jgi:hypothetical protein
VCVFFFPERNEDELVKLSEGLGIGGCRKVKRFLFLEEEIGREGAWEERYKLLCEYNNELDWIAP